MEPFFSITVYGFVWYVPCSFFFFSVLFNKTVSLPLTFGFLVMFRHLSAYVFIFCFAALSFSLSSLSNVGVIFGVCGSLVFKLRPSATSADQWFSCGSMRCRSVVSCEAVQCLLRWFSFYLGRCTSLSQWLHKVLNLPFASFAFLCLKPKYSAKFLKSADGDPLSLFTISGISIHEKIRSSLGMTVVAEVNLTISTSGKRLVVHYCENVISEQQRSVEVDTLPAMGVLVG